MTRRIHTKGSGYGQALFLWLALSGTTLLAQPNRFTFQRGLMGTQFNVILYAQDSLTANKAYQAVSARMDTLNQIMSDYLDGSEINRLSASSGSAQWVPVSRELFDVLTKAVTIARTSGGRYDPTIGPLSLLWRRAVRRNQFPSAQERKQARKSVGYQHLDFDTSRQSIRLNRPNMRLDVGGIGQGFAIDEALLVIKQFPVQAALFDIGGDILAYNAPPQQAAWRIDVGSGKTGDTDTLTVNLLNAAITTSGDTYRYLNYRGRRYSHIMDPRSGLGLRHFVRATIKAPEGYHADALTKVFSVAGWKKSRRLLRRFPGAELYIIENKKGNIRSWQSPGFR